MAERGKFIVIYGANNLGKSTQVGLLAEALRGQGFPVKEVKYPIYDLEPTGPRINAALRADLPVSDLELQREFAQNRREFEPYLRNELERGVWVVAEDYTGTGVAWGVTRGLPLEIMEEINRDLLREDIAILLDGERFTSGIERQHRHECSGDWEKARFVHLELAERYGWHVVDANRSAEEVHREIMTVTFPDP